tara:strand:- start:3962 stop:4357 length:396 start_codon:yes stop_codon:yes gene_type:complete
MFSKEMLIGVFLGSAKMDFSVQRAKDTQIGYRVKVKLLFRAEEPFLQALARSLEQHQIGYVKKRSESKARPKPIISIGGVKNLYKVMQLVPSLPDHKGEWETLREVIELLSENKQNTAKGLDRIFELKGVI